MITHQKIISDIKNNPKKYIKENSDSSLYEILTKITEEEYVLLVEYYYRQIKDVINKNNQALVEIRGIGAYELTLSQIIKLLATKYRMYVYFRNIVKKEYNINGHYKLNEKQSYKEQRGYYYAVKRMDLETKNMLTYMKLYFIKTSYQFFHKDKIYFGNSTKEKSDRNILQYEIYRATYYSLGNESKNRRGIRGDETRLYVDFIQLILDTCIKTKDDYFLHIRSSLRNEGSGIDYGKMGDWYDKNNYELSIEYKYLILFLKELMLGINDRGIKIDFIDRVSFEFIFMWCNGILGKAKSLISKHTVGKIIEKELGIEVEVIKYYNDAKRV